MYVSMISNFYVIKYAVNLNNFKQFQIKTQNIYLEHIHDPKTNGAHTIRALNSEGR